MVGALHLLVTVTSLAISRTSADGWSAVVRAGCHERPSLWPGKGTPIADWLPRERAIRPGVLYIVSTHHPVLEVR